MKKGNSKIDEAKELINKEKEARAKKVFDAIQKILTDEKCRMNVCMNLGGQNIPVEALFKANFTIVVTPEL